MNYKIRRHTLLIHVPLPTQGAQSRKGTAPTTVRAAQRGTRAARRAAGKAGSRSGRPRPAGRPASGGRLTAPTLVALAHAARGVAARASSPRRVSSRMDQCTLASLPFV